MVRVGKKTREVCVGLMLVGYISINIGYGVDGASNAIVAQSVKQNPRTATNETTDEDTTQSTLVDYDANEMVNRGDNITRLIGNVHFHHNGTIIQCDSAFQYPDDRMEFFGRVVIEKDSALIYGDRVYYNGNTNKADVYAPIVKMVRGKATLYSYNLQFDTKTSIGEFHSGGVLNQQGNRMESLRGFFDSENEYVKFLDSVVVENDDYLIKTDSLGFSINDEQLDFLTLTYIWSSDGSFLQANQGNYFSATKSYLFTSDAYVMSDDSETWADTMRYYSELKQAYMYNNVQILDSANATLAFGQWAFYDDSIDRAVLSDMPSVRTWNQNDTTYMRADTIILLTFPAGTTKEQLQDEEFAASDASQSAYNSSTPTELDTLKVVDTLPQIADSMNRPIDKVTARGDKESHRADSVKSPSEAVAGVIDTMMSAIEHIELESADSLTTHSEEHHLSDTVQHPSEVIAGVVDTMMSAIDHLSMDVVADSLRQKVDTTMMLNDSLPPPMVDSLTQMVEDSIVVKDTIPEIPSKVRLIRAYDSVRSWSAEYQSKCDSTVSYSVDSTATLYGEPVIWNQNNQITAEQIDVYTRDEEIDWVDCIGVPFIAQQVVRGDTLLFNQATGKELQVYFTDNDIDYAYMSGNVENIYYMVEERKVDAMVAIECTDLTMFFEKREPAKLVWRGQGSGPIYPIELVPEDQPRFLEGYSWQVDIRPKNKWEISPNVARPSRRGEASAIARPTFTITDAMDKRKEELIVAGEWSDRVDWPDITPEYFTENQYLY